jgi:peroxiredoxin family protein
MDSQQITEILLYGTGPKELLDRWKARQEKMAALREEREADPKAWEERVAAMGSRRITVRPEEMSADMKARLEETAAMTDKIWAARQEMRNSSHKETVVENKPETEVKTMACQEMEAHQEEEADLSGQETGGGRATRGPRR